VASEEVALPSEGDEGPPLQGLEESLPLAVPQVWRAPPQLDAPKTMGRPVNATEFKRRSANGAHTPQGV
jgi:hypothetical protein